MSSILKYNIFHYTIKGRAHEKIGVDCQDSSHSFSDPTMLIIAVADGHGDPSCFRSKDGSEFAVESAMECIKSFVNDEKEENNLLNADNFSKFANHLCQTIIKTWFNKVEEHLKKYPIKPTDWRKLLENEQEQCQQWFEQNEYQYFYGSTLIAGVLTENYCFGIQVGDGECLLLQSDGTFIKPIEDDSANIGNQTASISGLDKDDFRYFFKDKNELPLALFIGTDGIDKSFPLDKKEAFYSVYKDIIILYVKHGFDNSIRTIKNYLNKFSKKGSSSGDDISVAGIICINGLSQYIEKFFKERNEEYLEEIKLVENNLEIQKSFLKKVSDERKSIEKTKKMLEDEISKIDREVTSLQEQKENYLKSINAIDNKYHFLNNKKQQSNDELLRVNKNINMNEAYIATHTNNIKDYNTALKTKLADFEDYKKSFGIQV